MSSTDVAETLDEFPYFEDANPEFEDLMDFFSEMDGIRKKLLADRKRYEEDPASCDLVAYRRSGQLCSLIQEIEDAYGMIEGRADSSLD